MFKKILRKCYILLLSKEKLYNEIEYLKNRNIALNEIVNNIEKLTNNYVSNSITMYNLVIAKEKLFKLTKGESV